MSLTGELMACVKEGPIVDSHEHIHPRDPQAYEGLFALWRDSYVATDFFSAGMPPDVFELATRDEEAAWEKIKPYLDAVRNTAYYRSLIAACQELYSLGDDDITDDNWRAVSDAIRRAASRPGWDDEIFHRARITAAMQDTFWDALPEQLPASVLKRIVRINIFVVCPLPGLRDHNGHSPYDLQERFGVEVKTLGDYLEFFDAFLQWHLDRGAVGLKSAIAYDRGLYFADVSREDAEDIFRRNDHSPAAVKAIQDFMMHYVLERAQELDLPVQVHTGYLARADNLSGREPKQLTNLIVKFPRVRFDLFHGGYPFAGELAYLGRHFPNVYVDLCWLPIISPTAARQYLCEWLEQVPSTKILWGGDCFRADAALGALRFGQQVVVDSLVEQVRRGQIAAEHAFTIARRIFHDNAARMFLGGGE